jgi:hypothetical protein
MNFRSIFVRPVSKMRGKPNIRVEYARYARPTRNGEAPLLAAHAGR